MEKSLSGGSARERLRLPAKATLYYMFSSALAKAIGVLTTPIFTRILSSSDYGKYTLYMSWLGLFTLICSSAVSPTVIYRGLEQYKDRKHDFIISSFWLGLGFSGIVCALLFAFSGILGLNIPLIPILSIQLLCDVTVGFYQTLRRYNYHYKALSLTNAISVGITPLFAFFLIFALGIGYLGRIYALLFVSLAIAIPHFYRLISKKRGRTDKKILLYVAKRALPLLPHSVSTAVGAEVDKLMITAILGAEALAKYSVSHTVGLGIGFAITALASALYPWVIRKLSSGDASLVLPIANAILTCLAALGIVVSLFIPEVFAFLAPKEYAVAKLATIPLLLSTLPSFASSFITQGIVYAERSGYTSVSAAVSVVMGIIFNILFIPKLKYAGAGLSLLFSSLITLVINYHFLKRCGLEEIFSVPTFLKILSVFVISTLLSVLIYPILALRILALIIPLTLLLYAYSGIRGYISE